MLPKTAPLPGRRPSLLLLATVTVFLIHPLFATAADPTNGKPSPLDNAFVVLQRLELGQNLGIFNPIEQAVLQSHNNEAVRKDLENRLLGTLRADATGLAKEYACRQLAIVGSDDSLDTLAGLLPHPRLSHMARYALEGIDTPAAGKTLRESLAKTEGRQKAGVVISLGRMADSEAAGLIAPLLASEEPPIQETAVVALGRIGTKAAFEALHQFSSKASENLRSAVVNAELQAAEQLLKRGNHDDAVGAYSVLADEKADNPPRVRLAALRGLILSQPSKAVSLIVAGLNGEDAGKRTVAADCILSLKNTEQIKAVADAIAELPTPGKIAALHALRDNNDPSVRAATLKALDSPDKEVRATALGTLIGAGTGQDVPRLATLAATDPDSGVQTAAFETLRLMRHPTTGESIIALLAKKDTRTPTLLRAAFARRSPDFVPAFLTAAQSSDPAIRKIALEALEVMAEPEHAEMLVAILAKSAPGEEREAAGRAVWMTCEKTADPAKRGEPLFAGYEKADVPGKTAILPSIARIGGDKALATVHVAMKSPDKTLKNAAYRALANWPDATVADELLEIAKTSDNDAYRIWSLRAYARVVALPNAFLPEDAFKRLKSAMDLATRLEDRKLIVSRLAAVRTPASLELLLSYLDNAELKNDAVGAVFLSAKGLSQSHPDLAKPALKRVQELFKDEAILQQVRKVLRDIEARKQTPAK